MPQRLIPRTRRQQLVVLALNGLMSAVVVLCYKAKPLRLDLNRTDLAVYRIGADAWLHATALYGPLPPTPSGLRLPFTYPPIAAVLFAPLAVLPYPLASVLITVAGIALVGLVVWLFLRCRSTRLRVGWWTAALLPIALLVEPVRSSLSSGQINVALMALVALDCLVPRARWPRGVLVGLGAAVKLTPAVFVLFFLLRRDFRAAARSTATFVLVSALGWVLAPQDSVRYWTTTVFQTGRIGPAHFTFNQSVTGVLARLGLTGDARTLCWAVLCALIIPLAVIGMRRALAADRADRAVVLNAVAGLLISPVSWTAHWVWAVPAVLVLLRPGTGLPRWVAVVVLAVLLAGPPWFPPWGGDRELDWNGWDHLVGDCYVWLGAALLVAAARLRHPEPTTPTPTPTGSRAEPALEQTS